MSKVLEWLRGRRSNTEIALVNATQADEDAYDLAKERVGVLEKPIGTINTIVNLVKSALGSGILGVHVSYKKAGVGVALPLTFFCGAYLALSIMILIKCAQIACKRTARPILTYSDTAEAAFKLHEKPCMQKLARPVRYLVDTLICVELFGACVTYQLIISKTIKQLVEDVVKQSVEPAYEGYPHLRVYVAIMILPCVIICLLRHLKYVSPFALLANILVALCVCTSIYFCSVNNPKFENMKASTDIQNVFVFAGMIVFSLSFACQCITVENNMRNPAKYTVAIPISSFLCTCLVATAATTGYAAYLEDSTVPITINYPNTIGPKILKGAVAVMVYVTHCINFFVPFTYAFAYIKKRHNPEKVVMWEYFYRALFVIIIGIVAICFPQIGNIMSFLGCFALGMLAFILPSTLYLVLIHKRPGYGTLKWRLWRAIVMILIGIVIWTAGSVITMTNLIKSLIK